MELDEFRHQLLVALMLELRQRDDLTGKQRMEIYRQARSIIEVEQLMADGYPREKPWEAPEDGPTDNLLAQMRARYPWPCIPSQRTVVLSMGEGDGRDNGRESI